MVSYLSLKRIEPKQEKGIEPITEKRLETKRHRGRPLLNG